jgi:hypothetical protein
MLHEHKLCNRSQTSEQSLILVCRICSVRDENILMWIYEVPVVFIMKCDLVYEDRNVSFLSKHPHACRLFDPPYPH